jgi:hypothetical protein
MRVLLVVGGDANDQNLLQGAPFYNAFLGTGGKPSCADQLEYLGNWQFPQFFVKKLKPDRPEWAKNRIGPVDVVVIDHVEEPSPNLSQSFL